jgi:hypothetical protein
MSRNAMRPPGDERGIALEVSADALVPVVAVDHQEVDWPAVQQRDDGVMRRAIVGIGREEMARLRGQAVALHHKQMFVVVPAAEETAGGSMLTSTL